MNDGLRHLDATHDKTDSPGNLLDSLCVALDLLAGTDAIQMADYEAFTRLVSAYHISYNRTYDDGFRSVHDRTNTIEDGLLKLAQERASLTPDDAELCKQALRGAADPDAVTDRLPMPDDGDYPTPDPEIQQALDSLTGYYLTGPNL